MTHIAFFASGSGTNVQNIAQYFMRHPSIKTELILTNNKNAYVIERAKQLNIDYKIFTKDQLYFSNYVLDILFAYNINFIVLAGFLLMIPHNIIKAYPKGIVNIHPALLPKYGGKGMYGDKVHRAVKENNDRESGITVHYVNEHYDEGQIIFQAKCTIEPTDSIEDIANKAHQLEYEYYPKIIEEILSKK